MPMIDLTFVRGSVDEQALSRLTDELVTALLRAERAPDTPYLRDNTLVYLHAMEPAEVSVGGRGPGDPRFMHFYEMDTDDPEAAYQLMPRLVAERLGGASSQEYACVTSIPQTGWAIPTR